MQTNNDVTILNLSTGREYFYVGLNPIDALVSCSILENKQTSSLTDKAFRAKIAENIVYGKLTASIGDLTVKL
jgi:hypothetical protein